MLITILVSAGVVAAVGLILGALIGFTAKKFEVQTDPKIEAVQELLPGANCGGCGYAGCADFASAIVTKDADPSGCSACSDAMLAKIAEVTGKAAGKKEKMTAVVFCSGSFSRSTRAADYNGIQDCRSASIVAGGGGKACRFGCLGYGSCARACPFGAIEIRDGLAVVHPELCRTCGKCVNVCPRKLIRLVPASAPIHVYCNSLEKPAKRRKFCKNPCLACKKCIRTDENHMQMQGGLVRVNYSNPPEASFVEQVKCPTGALQVEEIHRKIAALKPAEPAPKAAPAPKKEESK